MFFIVGALVVLGSVIGGYVMHHGKLGVLWQPNEFIIIGGAAIGSFVISNPSKLVKDVLKNLKSIFKASPHNKANYLELLTMLYAVFKLLKTKGMLEIESHIENPEQSSLLSQYPHFLHNHHAVIFFCDYLRLMTMGIVDHMQMEELMDRELEIHAKEGEHISHALINMGDAMPALGIVAAVLGVITTMSSITEPPEVLGGLIGAALVGTFLGVLMSYGFIAPIGRKVGTFIADEVEYMKCIKVGLLAHLKGNAPVVSIEFARGAILPYEKPSFAEVETAVNNMPSAA